MRNKNTYAQPPRAELRKAYPSSDAEYEQDEYHQEERAGCVHLAGCFMGRAPGRERISREFAWFVADMALLRSGLRLRCRAAGSGEKVEEGGVKMFRTSFNVRAQLEAFIWRRKSRNKVMGGGLSSRRLENRRSHRVESRNIASCSERGKMSEPPIIPWAKERKAGRNRQVLSAAAW